MEKYIHILPFIFLFGLLFIIIQNMVLNKKLKGKLIKAYYCLMFINIIFNIMLIIFYSLMLYYKNILINEYDFNINKVCVVLSIGLAIQVIFYYFSNKIDKISLKTNIIIMLFYVICYIVVLLLI